jgi:hypothetical protein
MIWVAEGLGDRLIPKFPLTCCEECEWFYPEWGECHSPQWDMSQGCQYPKVDEDDFCAWGKEKKCTGL